MFQCYMVHHLSNIYNNPETPEDPEDLEDYEDYEPEAYSDLLASIESQLIFSKTWVKFMYMINRLMNIFNAL